MEKKNPEEIRRAVLNRDALVYPALRDLMDGGYLDCNREDVEVKEHVCRLTEKGRHAYLTAARAWERTR